MHHRCIDAGITSQMLDSGHCAILLKLQVMSCLKRKAEPRQQNLNLDHQKLSNPEIRKNLCEEVMRNIKCNADFIYLDVSNAVVKAASTVLPKRGKAETGWFQAETSRLLPLMQLRNDAMRNVFNRRTRHSTARLVKKARKLVKTSKLLYMKRKQMEHKHWNKISLGCNKHLKRRIVRNQTILF